MRVIVTGLAGSGKSTFAKSLALPCVSADDHRYEPAGTWTKASYTDFKARVQSALAHAGPSWVYESSFIDTSDPERARERVIKEMLPEADMLIIFSDSKENVVANILRRSFGRLQGVVTAGAAPETPESVSKLILKVVSGYSRCCDELDELAKGATSTCTVVCTRWQDADKLLELKR